MNGLFGVSIVIRTLNEEEFLPQVIHAINKQQSTLDVDLIIVDSGSTDRTLEVARKNGCRIKQINSREFTFGRSLNLGISVARHDVIVSLSAHCIPSSNQWLSELIYPIYKGVAQITFGSHVAHPKSRTSEKNYFKKKYSLPDGSCALPLMNNGNAAFLKSLWNQKKFDEHLLAQEDLEFCRWHQINSGALLWFSSDALVEHYHNDNNKRLLKRLTSELHVEYRLGLKSFIDIITFLLSMPMLVYKDLKAAKSQKVLFKALIGICTFRFIQSCSWIIAYLKAITYKGGSD